MLIIPFNPREMVFKKCFQNQFLILKPYAKSRDDDIYITWTETKGHATGCHVTLCTDVPCVTCDVVTCMYVTCVMTWHCDMYICDVCNDVTLWHVYMWWRDMYICDVCNEVTLWHVYMCRPDTSTGVQHAAAAQICRQSTHSCRQPPSSSPTNLLSA